MEYFEAEIYWEINLVHVWLAAKAFNEFVHHFTNQISKKFVKTQRFELKCILCIVYLYGGSSMYFSISMDICLPLYIYLYIQKYEHINFEKWLDSPNPYSTRFIQCFLNIKKRILMVAIWILCYHEDPREVYISHRLLQIEFYICK